MDVRTAIVTGDVTSAEFCHALVERAEDAHGPVDRLVHPGGRCSTTSTGHWPEAGR